MRFTGITAVAIIKQKRGGYCAIDFDCLDFTLVRCSRVYSRG